MKTNSFFTDSVARQKSHGKVGQNSKIDFGVGS